MEQPIAQTFTVETFVPSTARLVTDMLVIFTDPQEANDYFRVLISNKMPAIFYSGQAMICNQAYLKRQNYRL